MGGFLSEPRDGLWCKRARVRHGSRPGVRLTFLALLFPSQARPAGSAGDRGPRAGRSGILVSPGGRAVGVVVGHGWFVRIPQRQQACWRIRRRSRARVVPRWNFDDRTSVERKLRMLRAHGTE